MILRLAAKIQWDSTHFIHKNNLLFILCRLRMLYMYKQHRSCEQFHGSWCYQNEDNSLPFEELKEYPCSLDLLFLQFFGTLGYNNIVGVDKLTKKIRTVTSNKKDILQGTRDLVFYSKSLAYMQLYSQIGLCYNFTTKL